MTRMRKFIPVAAAAAASLSLAAIPAFASTTTVKLKDDSFSPSSKTIHKGTTVKFVWAGHDPHNVTVTSGPQKFHSSTQTSGHYSHKFTKAGTYKIVCTIHAGMHINLKVS